MKRPVHMTRGPILRMVFSSKKVSDNEFQSPHDGKEEGEFVESDKGGERSAWRLPTGCRMGVILACFLAYLVLLTNISIFLWANSTYNFENGTCTLYQGDCNKAKRLNTWFQLIINVLSTLLLGASNYCMQCLGAPSREEVDRAHTKKVALEIGAPAPMNLKWINPYRAGLWILLGLTALPIHFLYNSVLLLRTQANRYKILGGPMNFLKPEFDAYKYYHDYNNRAGNAMKEVDLALLHRKDINSDKYELLNVEECIDEYSQQYVSRWGDVVLIQDGDTLQSNQSGLHIGFDKIRRPSPTSTLSTTTSQSTSSTSHYDSEMLFYDLSIGNPTPGVGYANSNLTWNSTETTRSLPLSSNPDQFPSNKWQCLTMYWFEFEGYCNASTLREVSGGHPRSKWMPFGHEVRHCWAEKVKEECSLAFHRGLGLSVIACNLVKAVCMCITLLWLRRPGFMTLGDAIESFLNCPDPHTEGICTFSASQCNTYWDFEKCMTAWRNVIGIKKRRLPYKDLDKPWKPKFFRWWRSVSPFRWHSYILLLWALTTAGIVLLMVRENDGNFQLGFGSLPGKNKMSAQLPLMTAVLLANMPQLFCSYIFLGFNYILTNMCTGHEWMTYSQRRQPLRVTNPKGGQRNTYFLQLPYRLSIPLLAMSGLISWLASQVMFIIQVRIRPDDDMSKASIMTCGYSPGALVILIIVGTTLATGVLILGLKRFPDSMPLAATNSAAISAACHADPDDEGCALKPLQWGVVSHIDKIGHCSFSAGPVKALVAGQLYR